jgi:hypothetical protein
MTSTRRWLVSTLAVAALTTMASSEVGASVSCARRAELRVTQFGRFAEHVVASCLRRSARGKAACPNARLADQLARRRAAMVSGFGRRCAGGDLDSQLAAVEARVLCNRLAICGPPRQSITVKVGHESAGGVAAAQGSAARAAPVRDWAVASGSTGTASTPSSRILRVDAGWTGNAHDLQVFEGAGFTAELSECNGVTDTACDLHGATAGIPFGAPSPITAGGVAVCVPIVFDSDLTGAVDLATGELTESARVRVGVFSSPMIDEPCPACLPADGDPQLGEAGTCNGGPNAGLPCTVGGLAGPEYGSMRGTSNDCPPEPRARLAEFVVDATATTNGVTFGTSAESPDCRAAGFTGLKCQCDTCNDAAGTPCRSNADCPVSGGNPGVCGGKRCSGGTNHGAPCSALSECPAGYCIVPGAATAPNACDDGLCTPTGDGGACLAGPNEARCRIRAYRWCIIDDNCGADDTCGDPEPRSCLPDPIALTGTPDPPQNNVAHPTLVGGFCMGPASSGAVNSAAGFPGPTSFVWPAELTFSE